MNSNGFASEDALCVLCLGDIIGRGGRNLIASKLEALKEEYNIDFVIANGENSAGGFGITRDIAHDFLNLGIDAITSGNHIWRNKDIFSLMKTSELRHKVLRPFNYPDGAPGFGYQVYSTKNTKIGVINVLGRTFIDEFVDCPFKAAEYAIKKISEETDIIFIDFHAEATSEKQAMGYYLDGKASCIFGTHTHVQTADERILNNGTAYITDLGMCGSYEGIIGSKPQQPILRFTTGLPHKFEVESEGMGMLNGIVVSVNKSSGKAIKIKRVFITEERRSM